MLNHKNDLKEDICFLIPLKNQIIIYIHTNDIKAILKGFHLSFTEEICSTRPMRPSCWTKGAPRVHNQRSQFEHGWVLHIKPYSSPWSRVSWWFSCFSAHLFSWSICSLNSSLEPYTAYSCQCRNPQLRPYPGDSRSSRPTSDSCKIHSVESSWWYWVWDYSSLRGHSVHLVRYMKANRVFWSFE